MIKVKSTTDYSRFKFMRGNRPIDKRINKMVRAVKRKNMLADFPILCRSNNDGRMYICDGQTRFEAAKKLGLPVFYIESPHVTLEDISQANSVQTPWTNRDYLESWCEQGNAHFIKLRQFIREFGLPITISASLLSDTVSASGNIIEKLRTGTFHVKAEEAARRTASFIAALKQYCPFSTDRSLVVAFAKILKVRSFEPKRFLDKLSFQRTRFVKCANCDQYVAMIEEIYNYKTQASSLIALSMEVKKLK